MARGHVLRERRVLMGNIRPHVARYTHALVEQFDCLVGVARFDDLAQQSEWDRIIALLDLDVVIRRNRTALPLRVAVALGRERFDPTLTVA